MTDWTLRTATKASDPDPPGSLSGQSGLPDVGDSVLELQEDVRAVVDAESVARAQVLVDPDAHRHFAR